ncbi:hypothetical protein [Nonomuraea sp. SYSU D8015]|uniref:hypothetical protein n=1 Tax=Nonomuraea sp. SYSU D8015 TaxID=2593644 RepID=UPI001660C4B5|nr:hypothetical protein [Nonomuraea sp. SYSU D8015]
MTAYINAKPMYQTRLAYDLLPCDEAVQGMIAMGLTPPSGDTADMEHAHSHARSEAVEHYEPRIELMSQICTDIILMKVLDPSDLEDLEPEQLAALKASYTQIISICSSAIIGNLMADEASGLRSMVRKGGMQK